MKSAKGSKGIRSHLLSDHGGARSRGQGRDRRDGERAFERVAKAQVAWMRVCGAKIRSSSFRSGHIPTVPGERGIVMTRQGDSMETICERMRRFDNLTRSPRSL